MVSLISTFNHSHQIQYSLTMTEEQKAVPLRRRNKSMTEKKTDECGQVKSEEDEKSESE